ncbi:hypothetical protein Bca101_024656 [Brassica carinata]
MLGVCSGKVEFRSRFSSSLYSLSFDGDFDHILLYSLNPHGSRLACALNRNGNSDFETEHKLVRLEKLVCDLAKKRSSFINGFEVFVGVMIIALVFIDLVICFK